MKPRHFIHSAVTPDSGGPIQIPNRISCLQKVTPVTLGLFPRLMHIPSSNKISESDRTTWVNFLETTVTNRRLQPRPLTWPLNRNPRIRGLNLVVSFYNNNKYCKMLQFLFLIGSYILLKLYAPIGFLINLKVINLKKLYLSIIANLNMFS